MAKRTEGADMGLAEGVSVRKSQWEQLGHTACRQGPDIGLLWSGKQGMSGLSGQTELSVSGRESPSNQPYWKQSMLEGTGVWSTRAAAA